MEIWKWKMKRWALELCVISCKKYLSKNVLIGRNDVHSDNNNFNEYSTWVPVQNQAVDRKVALALINKQHFKNVKKTEQGVPQSAYSGEWWCVLRSFLLLNVITFNLRSQFGNYQKQKIALKCTMFHCAVCMASVMCTAA